MADVNKAHQLSAARKKLREYQKHRKSKPNENGTPAESPTDSTHSSSNEAPPANASPLQNYFNRDAHAKETASFFDDDNFVPARPQELNSTESPKAEDEDVLTIEDPEVNPNVIYDHLHRTMEDVDEDSCEGDGARNMESLKQLSTQIIQLIDDGAAPDLTPQKRQRPHEFDDDDNNTNRSLLTAALQEEKDARAESESRLRLLEAGVSQREERLVQLEEQLACHQRTVNILVAEKAELTTALGAARSKTAECEELGARLKTSRSRVADLEKELNVLRLEKSRHDERGHREYAELAGEHETLKGRQEEALQDISELRGKLSACLAENSQLQRELQDSNSQLSVLGVRLRQLSTAENAEATGQIENAMGRNAVLEKEIVDLHGTIKTLTGEKDQASLQYQRYVQQLNNHTSLLAQNLEAKAEENEALVLRVRQLTDQMGELEKVLQRLGERKSFPVGDTTTERQQLEEAMNAVEELRGENALLEEKYGRVIGEREELLREVENKRGELARLEEAVSELREDRPDNARLLASIESDKVAASRAVAQNAELKRQLEEMQEVFIKMSNDKLELTEKLTGEQHKGKDLHERLDQFESQIHTLTDAIEIKDREMVSLRESAAELNKYVLQQNQLEDRLRHYEAHDHSTHALQFELQESYKRIQNLKIENEKLETRIENMEKKRSAGSALEGLDRAALQNKIDELERINKEIETKLTRNNNNNNDDLDSNPDDSILSRESAMAHLEEKFARTMQDIANLQDEKQRLEHLVLQLQSETETIGEYVALYQHQRGVLKQRALEREEQMKQLTSDREMMKNKLERLNRLIKALLVEKGNSSDLLNREIISASKLCTEHAKLHEEINVGGVENGAALLDAGRSETAEKIIELLGEIKTSNLVQPLETSESFHPCPWCSGQLITV